MFVVKCPDLDFRVQDRTYPLRWTEIPMRRKTQMEREFDVPGGQIVERALYQGSYQCMLALLWLAIQHAGEQITVEALGEYDETQISVEVLRRPPGGAPDPDPPPPAEQDTAPEPNGPPSPTPATTSGSPTGEPATSPTSPSTSTSPPPTSTT